MKQLGLRYLYKHLGKALRSGAPFKVTDHNKDIAIVFPMSVGEFDLEEGWRLLKKMMEADDKRS